jgi:hypothetical protein
MAKKLTLEIFLTRAKEIHGDLYDYTYVLYTNMHTKVKIIDPEFGEFEQTPMGHIQNGQGHKLRGANKAADKRRMTLEEFITTANTRHKNFYDYSKVEYKHCDKKVCIIDPEYGEFWQTPYNHLRNHGCPERTKQREWLVHVDHIVPLSVICTQNRSPLWVKNRPLYKFLNSDINLRPTTAKFNRLKHDIILVNGKEIFAGNIRNNYDVIKHVCNISLNVDITDIIKADKEYINNFLFDK